MINHTQTRENNNHINYIHDIRLKYQKQTMRSVGLRSRWLGTPMHRSEDPSHDWLPPSLHQGKRLRAIAWMLRPYTSQHRPHRASGRLMSGQRTEGQSDCSQLDRQVSAVAVHERRRGTMRPRLTSRDERCSMVLLLGINPACDL